MNVTEPRLNRPSPPFCLPLLHLMAKLAQIWLIFHPHSVSTTCTTAGSRASSLGVVVVVLEDQDQDGLFSTDCRVLRIVSASLSPNMT